MPWQGQEEVQEGEKEGQGKEEEEEGVVPAASLRQCRLLQDDWLQQTADQIKNFTVEQAIGNVSCLSFESALLAGM